MSAWPVVAAGAMTGVLSVALLSGGLPVPGTAEAASATTEAGSDLGPPAALNAVACPSPLECIAVGSDKVTVSSTGGVAWRSVTIPTSHFLYGLACSSPAHCVAVGDQGAVIVTTDGARTWSLGGTGVSVPLSSVACPSDRFCYAVGDGNTVLGSTDGGFRWHTLQFQGLGTTYGVACSSATHCTAVTSNADQSLVTIDGTAWTPVTMPFSPLDALFPLNGTTCAGSSCLAVGSHGLLAQSINGGVAWSAGQSITSQDLQAASCPTATQCVVVGSAGTILTTTDGGAIWQTDPPPTDESLLGVSCPTTSDCVAVGSGGTVLTSSTGGAPWTVRAGLPVPVPGLRVLVVGDSFAHTLALGLERNAPAYGVTLIDRSSDGCALARGSPVFIGGKSSPVSGPCGPTGPGWPTQYQSDAAFYRPALSVLVLGPWDLSSRFIAGQWLTPGQPGYDTYYREQVEAGIAILLSGGGRVAVTTMPEVRTSGPEQCPPSQPVTTKCPTETERVTALNAVARQAAARSPGRVTVIDLSRRLSPRGTFAGAVDGVEVRAVDGVHMSEPGDEWLTPWLIPRLLAAAR